MEARVRRRGDVAADVEPVRQAPPGELRDEREQAERKPCEEPLVPSGAIHPGSVQGRDVAGQPRGVGRFERSTRSLGVSRRA